MMVAYESTAIEGLSHERPPVSPRPIRVVGGLDMPMNRLHAHAFPDALCEIVRPHELRIGDLLADDYLPRTGVAVVVGFRKAAYVYEVDVIVATDDGDADETVSFHSTLPLRRVKGVSISRAASMWYVVNRPKTAASAADLDTAVKDAFSPLGLFGYRALDDPEQDREDVLTAAERIRDHGIDYDDTRDFVPYPEWMERSPETGEVP